MSISSQFKDIFVVVHGIGDQYRFATARQVANRLAGSRLLAPGPDRPVAPQPLGYFHADAHGTVSVQLVDQPAALQGTELATVGVAEAYWADIPRKVVDDGYILDETKAWAHTVVARAEALYRAAERHPGASLVPTDFSLAAEVLDEIVETIAVLENLTFLADKAGLFAFDLRQVLRDYVDDVQLVAEFRDWRAPIVGQFLGVMEKIYDLYIKNGDPELRLHIVAHSEGTVVSFLGLLLAMSGLKPGSSAPAAGAHVKTVIPAWLKHVHGFLTIGSPIDKHLLLWPQMWEGLDAKCADPIFAQRKVQWRNYYDYGDPVGFKLDTARLWLKENGVNSFAFDPKKDDIGFARYLFPGKAHNDYWTDQVVFDHFIADVVRPQPGVAAQRPRSRKFIAFLSPTLPYLLSFVHSHPTGCNQSMRIISDLRIVDFLWDGLRRLNVSNQWIVRLSSMTYI